MRLQKRDLFLDEVRSIIITTKKLWNSAKKKTFLFTGCTGFFGIWLLKTFIEADKKLKLNCRLFVLTRNKKIKKTSFYKKLNTNKINFIYKDIRNFRNTNLKKIDYIVHGATTSALETYNKQNYKLKYSIIVNGTKNIINLARRLKCKNFFYMSSGAVYGYNLKKNKFNESQKIKIDKKNSKDNDITILGKAKFQAEKMIINEFKFSNTNYIIARFFSFIGPFMPLQVHYAAGNFLKSIIMNKNMHLLSNGKSLRTYMYIKDCIIWIIFSMFLNNSRNSGIYNIGGSKSISILKLAQKILAFNNNKSKIILDKKNKNFNFYVPSVSKFKKNFNPPKLLNLDNALKKTYFHIKRNMNLYGIS